jgi:3-oxoacyl-[acyl-carrier protein] reductase
MIDLGLEGKGALVSGAGFRPERAGHGRATALNLATAGAKVACVDIDEERAAGTVAAIEEIGGKAFRIVADMTDPAQVTRAVDEAAAGLGSLDVCVDIIGAAQWDQALDTSDETWDWTILNNVPQVFYLFRAAGRRMADQGTGGAIVALASVDGIFAANLHAPYGAAKAGVISLVKTFAHELGRYGIRVNAVAPGNVGAGNADWPDDRFGGMPINPLGPPRTQDIADAALFLCTRLAQRVSGQTLVVDGAATVKDQWGLGDAVPDSFRAGTYD